MNDFVALLSEWCDGHAVSLGAIAPDGGETSWLTTTDLDVARAFVAEHQSAGRNVYAQYNICRPDLGTHRADKKDVAVAVAVHAEIDPPPTVSSPAELEAWQGETGARLVDEGWWRLRGLPRPTLTAFSGSGFVVVWRLAEPKKMWTQVDGGWVEDLAAREFIEARNRKLVEVLGADPASTDVSRLLRLPGTTNFPAASKVAKGRVGPEEAVLLEYDPQRRAPAGLLPAAAPRASASPDARPLPEFSGLPSGDALVAAVTALGEAWPNSGRHLAQLALAGALARLGWPAEHVASFVAEVCEIQQPGNGDYVKRFKDATRTVERVSAGEVVQGWPSLIEHVGEAAVEAACRALGVPRPASAGAPEVLGFLSEAAAAMREASGAPVSTPIEIESRLKEVQRRLHGRKDADAIRDAEFLKRVLKSDLLFGPTDDDDVRRTTLALAAVAVARSVPPGTSADAITAVMYASVGGLAADLEEVVPKAMALASTAPDICARAPKHEAPSVGAAAAEGVDELVVESQGKRAGRPDIVSQHNVRVCLRRLGIELKYNEFTSQELISFNGSPFAVVQDHHIKGLRATMESSYDFRPEKENLYDLMEVIAREATFHPIKDYFASLADVSTPAGGNLTERWLIDYAGAPDTPYVRAVSRLVLVAAVRRVRRPGCKFDEMLILETLVQGRGKSTAIRTLCADEEWFTDDFSLRGKSTREMMETTTGKWIIEAGELAGMSKADNRDLKSYLSRKMDRARMAYGRKSQEIPRQFIVIGTTNDEQYLSDPSGDRRYWPVRLGEFDLVGLRAIRDELWAEACYLEAENPAEEAIRLDPELYDAAMAEQRKRRIDEPMLVMLDEALGGLTGVVRLQEVWRMCGVAEGALPSSADSHRIANAMRTIGFAAEARVISGQRVKCYVRGTGDARDVVLKIEGLASTGWRFTPSGVAAEVSSNGDGVVPAPRSESALTAQGN